MTHPRGTARGIGRSLRIYYGDHERTRRMDALNAHLVRPGGLTFDVGAHVGDRVGRFRRLGAWAPGSWRSSPSRAPSGRCA